MTDNGLSALAAAIHRWNEEHHEEGCVHFDKGYGPYAQCEDAGLDVPRGLAESTIATLRAAQEGAVAELEKPTELHDYRGGFHRSPDCPGCMMLARLRAALATAKGTGGPTLPPPDLDLIENSDGNGNRWPEATP